MELSRDNWGQVVAKAMFPKKQGVVRWGWGYGWELKPKKPAVAECGYFLECHAH